MKLHDQENQELILHFAKQYWPRTEKLDLTKAIRVMNDPHIDVYKVVTDSGNCIAIAFVDPENCMPWFQPTGSTEPDDCVAEMQPAQHGHEED